MKSLYTCLAAALLTMLSVGCSSSSTPVASSGSALDACKAYCTKLGDKCADASTGSGYTSTTDCTTNECVSMTSLPAACDAAQKAYYVCLAAQSEICAAGCTTEGAKILTDCK